MLAFHERRTRCLRIASWNQSCVHGTARSHGACDHKTDKFTARLRHASSYEFSDNNCNDSEPEGSIQGFGCLGKPNLIGTFKTHSPRTDGFIFDPNQFDNTSYDPSTGPNTDPTAITPGHFGNALRTLWCNLPINNWDRGSFKNSQASEKLRVEFRTEVYNIFNHAQFCSVDGNSGNQGATFGQPQRLRDPF
jgi:hypothetical protein